VRRGTIPELRRGIAAADGGNPRGGGSHGEWIRRRWNERAKRCTGAWRVGLAFIAREGTEVKILFIFSLFFFYSQSHALGPSCKTRKGDRLDVARWLRYGGSICRPLAGRVPVVWVSFNSQQGMYARTF
jgi:hypothetical protein